MSVNSLKLGGAIAGHRRFAVLRASTAAGVNARPRLGIAAEKVWQLAAAGACRRYGVEPVAGLAIEPRCTMPAAISNRQADAYRDSTSCQVPACSAQAGLRDSTVAASDRPRSGRRGIARRRRLAVCAGCDRRQQLRLTSTDGVSSPAYCKRRLLSHGQAGTGAGSESCFGAGSASLVHQRCLDSMIIRHRALLRHHRRRQALPEPA